MQHFRFNQLKSIFCRILLLGTFPLMLNAQTPSDNSNIPITDNKIDALKPLTREEAVTLALKQASNFQQAQIAEQIAAQDVRQAKTAFYPRGAVNSGLIYTSPSFSSGTGNVRPPSFLGANAIGEFQNVVNVAGEIDTSGKLRANLQRTQALLAAARAGSEIARRDLIFAVNDAYLATALATTKRRNSEQSLATATEFERITKLLLGGGEVAPVDAVRAHLQTVQRTDELEQAKAAESVAANTLKNLVGFDFTETIATTDLLLETPQTGEIESFAQAAIASRPELAQFDAQQKSAELDIKTAQAERRPQITYSVSGGFISDSLLPQNLPKYLGVQANIGVSIPLFDYGASKSRQTQAELRLAQNKNARQIAERAFAEQFFSARAQAISAVARIRLVGESIADAEKNVSASMARYQAGEAQINEVIDAQNLLNTQRTSLYQAIYDYQTARLRLLQAIGK